MLSIASLSPSSEPPIELPPYTLGCFFPGKMLLDYKSVRQLSNAYFLLFHLLLLLRLHLESVRFAILDIPLDIVF